MIPREIATRIERFRCVFVCSNHPVSNLHLVSVQYYATYNKKPPFGNSYVNSPLFSLFSSWRSCMLRRVFHDILHCSASVHPNVVAWGTSYSLSVSSSVEIRVGVCNATLCHRKVIDWENCQESLKNMGSPTHKNYLHRKKLP